jgi:predicted nucleic acid-binding protein
LFPLDDRQASLDANVILDFHLTGSTPVLVNAIPRGMLVSDFVQEELTKSDAAVPPGSNVVPLTTEEELNFYERLRRRYSRLGAGELGAIAVAHCRKAMLVSNDHRARSAAGDLGIEVSGSLGVLQSAVNADAITPLRAVQIMEHMQLSGAWLSDELMELFKTSVLRN